MTTLSLRSTECEIFDKIIARITDIDVMSEVIKELYVEIESANKDGIFGKDTVPDIQEILVALNEESLSTIEYFYSLCDSEEYLPKAVARYTDEIFPYFEDSVKYVLEKSCMPYRNSFLSYALVYNDRILPCQNILIEELNT